MTYKDLLKKSLTKEEARLLPSSFDIIGSKDKSIAIIEIPKELSKKEKAIAKAIRQKHKSVKSVLRKASAIRGVHRIRNYTLIDGAKDTEVMHVENGCRFLVDPQVTYFSPRESTERMRIVDKVLDDDVVMVFFAGVGPFPIAIERKSKPSRVIAIEVNPFAVDYFWRNIKLNKCRKIEVILGDVKGRVHEHYGKCDRVIMPLPERSIEYLDEAIKCLKSKGVCHFYCFSPESSIDERKEEIRKIARHTRRKISFEHVQAVLPYGPKIWKYRIDIRVD